MLTQKLTSTETEIFHSFLPLSVRETDKTHKVGMAQCEKVITVEIAKNTQRVSVKF